MVLALAREPVDKLQGCGNNLNNCDDLGGRGSVRAVLTLGNRLAQKKGPFETSLSLEGLAPS